MKICLVRLPVPFLIDDRIFPPLGLLAVGAGLKLQGHEVIVYDRKMKDLPLDFSYYGFGPTIPEYPAAVAQMQRIRDLNPKAVFCIGGPFASLDPGTCLSHGFDKVVIGDGEVVTGRLLGSDERVAVAQERPLDDYPFPDRSLIDIHKYKYMLEGQEATALVTSKGCPFHCGFCCKTYGSVRMRNAENVKSEIDCLRMCFGYRALVFMDDLFIMNRKRFESVAEHLRKHGIIWRCMVRADLLVRWGQDFVQRMADCGCRAVGMGVESGSDKILANVGKDENVDTIRKAVQLLKSANIKVKGFFILGLPGETKDTIEETRKFLEDAQLDDIDIKVFEPYPGSPIWERRELFDISWDTTNYEDMYYKGRVGDVHGHVRTSGLSSAEIVQKQLELEKEFKRG